MWELLHCRKNEAYSILALACAFYWRSIGDAGTSGLVANHEVHA